jgi:biotin carboxyl carrier protein
VTYEIEINGRSRRVDVQRDESGYIVTVDGQRHAADVTLINGVWSLILSDSISGAGGSASGSSGSRRSFEVAIVEQPPASGNLTVHVDGRLVTAAVGKARGSWARRGHDAGASSGGGPQRIVAPMPGKVVKLLVRPGETVVARQGVVVVEAMKMENELRAPKAGTVAEVAVAEGASVEAGAILAVID